MLVLIGLIVAFLSFSETRIMSFHAPFALTQYDMWNDVISMNPVSDYAACGLMCFRHAQCLSFTFIYLAVNNGRCKLHDQIFYTTIAGNGIENMDAKYYTIQSEETLTTAEPTSTWSISNSTSVQTTGQNNNSDVTTLIIG